MQEMTSSKGEMRYWRNEEGESNVETERYIGPRKNPRSRVECVPFNYIVGGKPTSEPAVELITGTLGAANQVVEKLGPSFRKVTAYGTAKNTYMLEKRMSRGIFRKYVDTEKTALARCTKEYSLFRCEETTKISEFITNKVPEFTKEVIIGNIAIPITLPSSSYAAVLYLGPYYDEVYSQAYKKGSFELYEGDMFDASLTSEEESYDKKPAEKTNLGDRLDRLEEKFDRLLTMLEQS